jgi:enoyl-CoA hydratase/carnithine racemase
VVLRGAGGRAFIGGADIGVMAELDPMSARAFIRRIHDCCKALRALPVPVVACIEGFCLGAGLEIAAACDLRLAREDARFGMPEVRVGIPSVVEAALLPLLIGWGRTRWLLLTGESIGAAEALAWGLVERTAPAEELDALLEQTLASLCAGGPNALRLQKALIRDWEELPTRAAIARGIEAFADAYLVAEPAERMRAFLAAQAARRRARAEGG